MGAADNPQRRRKTMTETDDMNNGPVKKFRIGGVTATIWKNEAEGRSFYNTTINRSYKDKDTDEWQETSSYSHDDLLNVAKVAERAEAFIAKLQS
jgi:hypothetical protein